MSGHMIFNGQMFSAYLRCVCCALLIILTTGCGDESTHSGTTNNDISNSSPGIGSVALSIQWHTISIDPDSGDAVVGPQAIDDCSAAGVNTITCEVYDESNNLIASGGPWDCNRHGERIERIPAGPARTFVVLGWDIYGNCIYQGQTTSGVDINPGEIADVGFIDAYPFIPTLIAPANDALVDPNTVSLEWNSVGNADEYLVQVAQDVNFQTIIINETTPATTHAPSNLAPSTAYFWMIAAIDQYTNRGANSVIRRFETTASCTYNIAPTDQTVAYDGGVYDVTVDATPDECEWTTSEDIAWISLSPTGGSGDGAVTITVAANSGEARSADITIAGRTHTVNQDPVGCTYTIEPESQSVIAAGDTYDVTVTATPAGCEWTASENISWISLTPDSGSGDGTVSVTVDPNTSGARSADVTIAGQTHTVNQDAASGDTMPPTTPTGVAITPIDGWIRVTWNPSTDNVGVSRYEVNFCISVDQICTEYWYTTVPHPQTYEEWDSEPDTWYCVNIEACDAANNCSPPSETVCELTP